GTEWRHALAPLDRALLVAVALFRVDLLGKGRFSSRRKQMKQPPTNEPGERDGRKDFDFLIGSWKIRHRRLKERLKGCIERAEFEGTSEVWTILGGLGNMEQLTSNNA